MSLESLLELAVDFTFFVSKFTGWHASAQKVGYNCLILWGEKAAKSGFF